MDSALIEIARRAISGHVLPANHIVALGAAVLALCDLAENKAAVHHHAAPYFAPIGGAAGDAHHDLR